MTQRNIFETANFAGTRKVNIFDKYESNLEKLLLCNKNSISISINE